MDALLGPHIELVQKTASILAPSLAILSILGVGASLLISDP